MKYVPYLIGFLFGVSVTTVAWTFATDEIRKNMLIFENSTKLCSTMGFNSFNIDEHGNVFCKNVMKND